MGLLLRRARAALVLGAVWAGAGALVGGMIELVLNILPGPDNWLGVDIWPATLAIPGFLVGVGFSVVLWAVEGRRSFDELVLPRIALLGGVGGGILGFLFGLPLAAVLALAATSGASAVGTLALARKARRQELGSGDFDSDSRIDAGK